jgi:two-component system, NtrC family, sensor kinase
MGEPSRKFKLNFQAKVLIPVVTVLVVFVGVTLWIFSSRVEQQLRREAELQRANFQGQFTNAVAMHGGKIKQDWAARLSQTDFFGLANELRDPGLDPKTFDLTIDQMFWVFLQQAGEEADVALYISSHEGRVVPQRGQLLAGTNRHAGIDLKRFYASADASVNAALDTHAPDVRIIEFDNRLFQVVSAPSFGATEKDFFGVVCVGVELGSEFARQAAPPGSDVAIIVNDRLAGSTLTGQDAAQLDAYRLLASRSAPSDLIQPIGNEHCVGLAGIFPGFSGQGKAGYLLLSSYEKSLQEFRGTQHALLLGSLLGILVGTMAVWWLVRRATLPLRQLRDTAEAVGRGDFSRRVQIASADELGELAKVFNQMTENLQESLAKLEKTVEILRTTQAQLVHSEKLSVVGEFVAGVAHELNNPLTTLIGYAELLQTDTADEETRDSLKRISNSADRCHKIVQSLLGFARQHPPERKLSNINHVVDAVLEILIYELRTSNISVRKDYAPNLPRLLVDPHQLQQVFLNIINNARQAMEAHQPKGSVRITTAVVGQRVQIRFQDDGPGISEENLAKIFNPFFTTKPVGKGTGLGLSLSYGIIQEHGGKITAESELGRGTAFIIELPITTGAEAAVSETAAAPARKSAAGAGRGRKVLVVDDEMDILDLVALVLEHDGYAVQKALDGQKALDCLAKEGFDLIVSDWKMPGMNGKELHERLVEINPLAAERMIFMTGDVLSEKVEKYLASHGKQCLAKPFSLGEFRTAVSGVFEAKGKGTLSIS